MPTINGPLCLYAQTFQMKFRRYSVQFLFRSLYCNPFREINEFCLNVQTNFFLVNYCNWSSFVLFFFLSSHRRSTTFDDNESVCISQRPVLDINLILFFFNFCFFGFFTFLFVMRRRRSCLSVGTNTILHKLCRANNNNLSFLYGTVVVYLAPDLSKQFRRKWKRRKKKNNCCDVRPSHNRHVQ